MLFVVVWGWICYFMLIYFCQKTVCMTMKMTVTVHQSVLQFVKTVFMNKHKERHTNHCMAAWLWV